MDRNTIFDVLNDSCRRAVVRVLSGGVERDVERVATQVSNEVAAGDVSRVQTSMHHVHLPKMSVLGIVDYDESDGTVRLADTTEARLALEMIAMADSVGNDVKRPG